MLPGFRCSVDLLRPTAEWVPKAPRVPRGDSLVFAVRVFAPFDPLGPEEQDPRAPQSLIGATVRSTLKYRLEDTDTMALSAVDSTGGSTPAGGQLAIVDPAGGKVLVVHPAAATTGLVPAYVPLFCDVQVTLPAGGVYTLPRTFTVALFKVGFFPDVTQTEP